MFNKKYTIFRTSQHGKISKYGNVINKILKFSYKNIGGFLGATNVDDLIKKTDYLCGYLDEEKNICVVALYSEFGNSYKLFGCGTAHGSKEEKELLQSIIRTDIEKYNKWHWAEVSGVLEHWFKKYNGYPIPSDFAQIALSPKTIFPLEDGFHYDRDINHYMVTKIMYGFTDQAFFDSIIAKYENYFELRATINATATVKESRDNEKQLIDYVSRLALPFARMIVSNTYYLTDNMIEQLNLLCRMIKTVNKRNKVIEAAKEVVKIMESRGERLQCYSFAPIEKYITAPAF